MAVNGRDQPLPVACLPLENNFPFMCREAWFFFTMAQVCHFFGLNTVLSSWQCEQLQEHGGESIKLEEEVWDDSLLIHAWEKALKTYQASYKSVHYLLVKRFGPWVRKTNVLDSNISGISGFNSFLHLVSEFSHMEQVRWASYNGAIPVLQQPVQVLEINMPWQPPEMVETTPSQLKR